MNARCSRWRGRSPRSAARCRRRSEVAQHEARQSVIATSAPPASRAYLIEPLHQASEAEHSLCCQYLYATFSLRRTSADFPAESRGDATELVMTATQAWAYEIFYIARQEMEHLAIATNL